MFKQKYHLIGALVHGRGAFVYTMSHRFPADPNVTIEVLQRVLTKLSDEREGRLPGKLYLQLDNCVRENKNKAVLAYLCWLVQRRVFQEIHVSFLPVGHTHEDIDQVWSRTSIQMKGNDVCCDEELFTLIKKSFHHYGHQAECDSLHAVANIKDWLLEHCHEVFGLAGREIPHFKIATSMQGPAIFTKHRAGDGVNDNWREAGHIYNTDSGGFHLLRQDTPAPPFAADAASRPPPLQPKEQSRKLLDKLASALNLCILDKRVKASAFAALQSSLQELQETDPLPFSWPMDGQFPCEQPQHVRAAPRSSRPAPAVTADDKLRRANLERDADDEDIRLAMADEPHGNDDAETDDEQEPEEHVPIGLRTSAQEVLRVQQAAAAEQESQFRVQELGAHHFVIFEPDAEQLKESSGRPFWVGRIFPDWQDEQTGAMVSGVDRKTGVITVQNYTPYNVRKGGASSNKVAGEYGFYTPEFNVHNDIAWTTCKWEQVLFVLSHLIPHSGNPSDISPLQRSYFKLPNFLKSRLAKIASGTASRPPRSRSEAVFIRLGSKRPHAGQRAVSSPLDSDDEQHQDSEEDEHEPYQEPQKKKHKRASCKAARGAAAAASSSSAAAAATAASSSSRPSSSRSAAAAASSFSAAALSSSRRSSRK